MDYEGELECEITDEDYRARVLVMGVEMTGHGDVCDEAREDLLRAIRQAIEDETLSDEIRSEMRQAFQTLGGEEVDVA